MTTSASSSSSGQSARAGVDVDSALTVARLRNQLFGISTETTFGPGGRYIIRDRCGTGGMANVYRATDTQMDLDVALKLLRTDLWSSGRAEAATLRLLDEARKLAKTRSAEHIARVFNVDTCDGVHYISMEYIDGSDLRHWQKVGGRRQEDIIAAYLDAGRGLAELHRLGLVHLDFKPENVMVGERDAKGTRRDGRSWRAALVDLGLAMRVDDTRAEQPEEAQLGASGESLGYTLYIVGGTPAYTAPERLQRRSFSRASDQFSFCVAFYEALFRSHPFAGMPPMDEYITTERSDKPQLAESTLRLKYVHDVQRSICRGRIVPPPRHLKLPWGLLAALERGMNPDPAKRFKSMDALLDALTWSQRQRRRIAPIFAPIAAGLVFAAGGIYGYAYSSRCAGFDERVAAVWNREVAGRVAASFAGAPIGATVVRAFDDFAARWQSDSEAACQAHRGGQRSDTAFDRHQVCMRRALQVAGDAAEGLTSRAAVARVNPVQLAALGDLLTACDGASPDESSLPDTPESAALIRELDALATMEVLGALPEARVRAEALLRAAEALGVPVLTAEAAYRLGRILGQQRKDPREGPQRVEQAGRALALARTQAGLAHRGNLLLDAWTFDLKLRAETISRADADVKLPGGAERLAEVETIVELYGSDPQRAQILEARGLYWLRLGDPTSAIAALAPAVALRQAIVRGASVDATRRLADSVALAKSLVNLGSAALLAARDDAPDRDRRLDQAEECFAAAVGLWTEITGRHSLYTLRARMNLALALERRDSMAADAELQGVQQDLDELARTDPDARARGVSEWNDLHIQLARRAYDIDDRPALAGHLAALRQGLVTPQQDVMTTYLEAEVCKLDGNWGCVIERADVAITLGESVGDTANVAAARELRAEAITRRDGANP